MDADVDPCALLNVNGVVPLTHHSLHLRVFPILDPQELAPYSYFVHVHRFANIEAHVSRDHILVAHPEGVRVNLIRMSFLSFSWISRVRLRSISSEESPRVALDGTRGNIGGVLVALHQEVLNNPVFGAAFAPLAIPWILIQGRSQANYPPFFSEIFDVHDCKPLG